MFLCLKKDFVTIIKLLKEQQTVSKYKSSVSLDKSVREYLRI